LWRPRRRGGSWKIQRCARSSWSHPDETGGGSGRNCCCRGVSRVGQCQIDYGHTIGIEAVR
jgi:hypothetical protein